MQELTRRRIVRKLEALPDGQLYQVLDFIEFLEAKYAPGRASPAGGLERFAERIEDGMRARAVAAGVISRTMGVLGTASRIVDEVVSAGRDLLTPAAGPASGPREPSETAAPIARPAQANPEGQRAPPLTGPPRAR